MPNNCAVRWCQNTKRKTKDTGIRFFRFPREKYLKDEWLRRCGRGDDLNADNAVVCSVHFLTADYDIPLKYRLMGYKTPKNLRTLKEDAVPSINLSEGKFCKCVESLCPSKNMIHAFMLYIDEK